MSYKAIFKIAGLAGLFLLIKASWAIDATLPGAAEPQNVSQSLTSQKNQQLSSEPRVLPPVLNSLKQQSALGGENAKKIMFQLNKITIVGNHVFSTGELSTLYKDKLHKKISVADLFSIVQSITNYYRNKGYVISRAILPPQHIKNGEVTVRVIEGYIDKVEVSGNPKGTNCLVKAIGSHIKDSSPLQLAEMEKYLLIANEIPATQVKAVLTPAKKLPGAADINLLVEHTAVTGYFSYDNYGTRYIGPQQMTANIGLNTIILSGDALQFTTTRTPKGNELNYRDINYNIPIGSQGIRWIVGDTFAHTHPLFILAPAQIDGINANYYTTIQFPMIRERSQSLTLQTSFNYNDAEVTTFGEQLYTDHLRNVGLGVSYNFADHWYGANTLYGDIRKGLPILGFSSNINPATANTSRPGGHGNFTKFDVQLNRLQAIKGPVSLYALFKGQYSFVPLLAAEQFAFGGSQLGRGYDVAEIIGDKGIAGSLELRYDYAPSRIFQNLQFYMFYDAGVVWNYLFIGGTPRRQDATSAGLGVRFYLQKYISGNFMWTQPLSKQVAAEELIGRGKCPRMFFSVVAAYF